MKNAAGASVCKMAHYTGTGDKGTTSIIGRCGINKDDTMIEALGSFDELNATVGVVIAFSDSDNAIRALKTIQDDLHTACADIAAEAQKLPQITEQHVKRVEGMIAEAERHIEPQRSFVLPGGNREAALLHLARTVARRAERQLVKLANTSETNPLLLKYANRLSSLFHVMARVQNKLGNVAEESPKYEFWEKKKLGQLERNHSCVLEHSCCPEQLKQK